VTILPPPIAPPIAPPITPLDGGVSAGMDKPWAAFYGPAAALGDLAAVGGRQSVRNLDADPSLKNYSPQQIATLKAGGATVISYLNVGACEHWRAYWASAPSGFVPCGQNAKAWRGAYAGYPDETWMNLADPDWQALLLGYVLPRLLEMGVDGIFLDNMEIVEHGTATANGPCDAACSQGGLDLVRKIREKYPQLFIVMQNATSDVTRLGITGGVPFPSLLDGISHEEVYAPAFDATAERQLLAWKSLSLTPRGRPFWIATEDYVGNCSNVALAHDVYARSRALGFRPYATDASAGQQAICWWSF
jgi:cysteinyl-tRNA synthetase